MFKLVAIVLVALFANCAFAKIQYAALDHCKSVVAAFIEPYTGFYPIKTVGGVTTVNSFVTSAQTPHIQINAEPKPTADYYEVVLDQGKTNELRRRRSGASYIVLAKGTRSDLLDKFEPLPFRIETGLQPDGKRYLKVYVHNEPEPFLSGVDPLPALRPAFVAFGSYNQQSKFFYDCEPIPAPVCPAAERQIASQTTQITSLKSQVEYLLQIISNAYTQSLRAVPTTVTSTVIGG